MVEQAIPVGASYYRARYYDEAIGRFTSEDPIESWGGNNFYRYAHNNVNFGDPFGLTDYNQQQTIEQFLQQAYSDSTAGYFVSVGLRPSGQLDGDGLGGSG